MSSQNDDLRRLDEMEQRIVELGNELRGIEQERMAIVRRLMARPKETVVQDTKTPKLLLTGDEAAATMSICRKTLYRLTIPRGPIPTVKVGPSGIRYSVEAIRNWIAGQEKE